MPEIAAGRGSPNPQSEPSQLPAEKMDDCFAIGRAARPSPLEPLPGPRPKPRGIAGTSPALRARINKSLETQTRWRSSQSVSNSSLCQNPCSAGKVQGIRWITSIAPGPIGPSSRIRLVLSAHRLKFPTTENREIRASEQRVRRANRGQCDVINSARRQIFESGNLDEYLERTGIRRSLTSRCWPCRESVV